MLKLNYITGVRGRKLFQKWFAIITHFAKNTYFNFVRRVLTTGYCWDNIAKLKLLPRYRSVPVILVFCALLLLVSRRIIFYGYNGCESGLYSI